jgi:SAM-dependent methyltransferase
MPAAYEQLLVPVLFEPYAVDLARRVASGSPRTVLELAAGTGVVTAHLAGIPGVESVVATDLNDAMVSAGLASVPEARWERADALALPYPDQTFDAVACQFGVMFFPDRPKGFVEARRVLAPGGTCHFSCWLGLEDNLFAAATTKALARVLPEGTPDFLATIPHGYADRDQVAADLREGGFEEFTMESVGLSSPAVLPREVAIGFCTGTPLRGQLEARGDLASLTEAIAADVDRQLGDEPVEGGMSALVVTAR